MRENRIERVPYDKEKNYTKEFVEQRRKWLSEKTGNNFKHISYYSTQEEEFRGNIENFIGVAQVPIGLMGPLKVNGDHAKGTFYVPFATTEGAMVETYQRGAIAITKSGGASVFINKDENHLDPIFIFKNGNDARSFSKWVKDNFEEIKKIAERTTGFGKLLNIIPHLVNRRVILDCAYYTRDAMGANMINIATEEICKFIEKRFVIEGYILRSNFSSEKKASGVSLLHGYGKEVFVEVVLPKKIVRKFLFSSPEQMSISWNSWILASLSTNMLGMNAHLSNGAAAIFIACGQDVAHIANVSVGILLFELTKDGDLYAALKLPSIIVGTVGGGTALGTQKEALETIGCYGANKSQKFAEIVGTTLLAGEIGICAGLTSKYFLDPHRRARVYTRERAFKENIN